MKLTKIITVLMLIITAQLSAQIGVNTDNPDPSAVLDIDTYSNDKGLLLPRMTTAQKLAISSPAHSLTVYDTDYKCISQYKDSQINPNVFEWTCLTLYNRHWFYMPSINIPTASASGSILAGVQTIDLYTIYNTGFATPKVKSAAAPVSIPFFTVNQLNYYVTYHDPCITINGITDAGELSYTVNKLPDYDAFLNIVFVIK